MPRSQLNSYNGSDPIWGFVAQLGVERFTGESAVGLDPRVRLFAVEGRIYLAEREGDAPIGTRLVSSGALSAEQLKGGTVRIADAPSLARLFQREPGIDRDAVELTVEAATESLLESIANKPVGMPEVFPLRHHSSGLHHWLRSTATTSHMAGLQRVPEERAAAERAAADQAAADQAAANQAAAASTLRPLGQMAPTGEATLLATKPMSRPALEPLAVATGTLAPWNETETVAREAAFESEPIDAPTEPTKFEALVDAWSVPAMDAFATFAQTTPDKVPAFAALGTPATFALLDVSAAGDRTATAANADEAKVSEPPATAARTQDDSTINPYEPGPTPTGLPKLATAPMSMAEFALTAPFPATVSPWSQATPAMAAVGIWEMVDEVFDEARSDSEQMVSSDQSAKRTRGWLRGRKD